MCRGWCRSAKRRRAARTRPQSPQMFHCVAVLCDGPLQFARIPVDGVLHDEGEAAAADFHERGKERTGVLGPKNEAVTLAWRKGDAVVGASVWIAHQAVSRHEPAQKPLGVEGGNVGPVACRNDHCFAPEAGEGWGLRTCS